MKNIRYTKGPDEIELGNIKFKRDEAQPISDEMAAQALLPPRVAEYGFEEVAAQPAPRAAAKNTDKPADNKE